MRHLKSYEALNQESIEVGDYFLFKKHEYSRYYDDMICKVTKIRSHYNEIEYETIDGKWDCADLETDSIEYWSKDKEDLEEIIAAKKYNL